VKDDVLRERLMTHIFQLLGTKTTNFFDGVFNFFRFLGHISYSFASGVASSHKEYRRQIAQTLQYGANIVLPLSLVCMILGLSLALSTHLMLSRFNLQQQAMFIAQNTLIHDIVPILIGFVLCAQTALNLIEEKHPVLKSDKEHIVAELIIPLIIGNAINAILLYTYITTALLVSIFITFHYIVNTNISEYMLRLSDTINYQDILWSIGRTLLDTTVASLTAGYYYYALAERRISMRHGVSRILLRGLFWLIMISGIIKIITPS